MSETIPPKWQGIVVDAIKASEERRKADPEFKGPDKLLIEIYNILVERMRGANEEEFIPEHQAQMAWAIRKVIRHYLKLADKYPPTHRKGFGEPGGVEVKTGIPELVIRMGGATSGGTTSGDGSGGIPEPEPDDGSDESEEESDDEESFDWVSDEEINRARSMMGVVSDEIGFDDFTDPLEFIREVARRLGGNWGLNGKRGNASTLSTDILAYRFEGYQPQLFDVIVGAGDFGQHLGWSALPYPQPAGAVWVAP